MGEEGRNVCGGGRLRGGHHCIALTHCFEEHAPCLVHAAGVILVALLQLLDIRDAGAIVETVLQLGEGYL
jgi:hypothetical protein